MDNELSERHSASGAVEGRLGDRAVVRHYGDSAAEYDAIRRSVGVIDRADLVQLRMWGRDPVRMLNGLITNDLGKLSERQAVYGALLTAKGRIIADCRVILASSEPTEVLVDVPSVALDAVTQHLKKFVPPLFARWEIASTSAVGVYGPAARGVILDWLGEAPDGVEDAALVREVGGVRVACVYTTVAGGEPGFDLYLPDEVVERGWTELTEAAARAGGRPVGFAALEASRVEAGRPRLGTDMTDESMPAEVFPTTGQMERAVSFTKGCYTGQEVVVRIAHRGHPNRHLRGLRFSGEEPPANRTPLYRSGEDREVGWVTSSVFSPLAEQLVGLGMIRREVAIDTELRVGSPDGPVAVVVDLPFR